MLADDRIRGDAQRAALVKDAETKSDMAKVLLRKKEFSKAREIFKYCTEADPVTPIYKALLAYSMYIDAGFDRDQAYEKGYPLILEALKGSSDQSATIHHYAGLILAERSKLKEALHHFRRAAELEPKNPDHQRQVRLLQGRIGKAEESSKGGTTSGLGRFFKR
ncbi:MAG: tetratricopeptide repeat protein [Myxococcales bacterium]|nr:tetratricopeptide repeat protein [Myxococcales bacterium]